MVSLRRYYLSLELSEIGERIMPIRTFFGLMMTMLLMVILTLAFNIELVQADLRRVGERDSFLSDNVRLTGDGARRLKERIKMDTDGRVRIVEHEITTSDLEKLKLKTGVYKEGMNYNKKIKGYGTGLRPPTEEGWSKILDEAYVVDQILCDKGIESLDQVDHSIGAWFPPIGNQDGEGSCVAWAVGYYMKTFQEAKEHDWDLSGAVWEGGYLGHPTQAYQDRIFSPDFIYHQINGGEDGGSYFSDAMNLVCSIGVCSWEKMPYDPNDHTSWPSEAAWREAPLYRGNSTGYEYVILDTNEDIANLKNWIASAHLAVINMDANQYDDLTSDDVWTLDNYAGGGGHANTIVGYDDNLEYIEESETRHGAFKIANSWGIGGWENVDDGCYWISYEAMKQREGYCMFFRDRVNYEPKLVASFQMDHLKRGECEITVGIGSRSTPIQTKRFDNWMMNGGDQPFCPNSVVFDITEFEDAVPTVINQSFFMKVFDGASSTTGAINSFLIEHYYDYTSGNLRVESTSDDVPVDTSNYEYVFAELVLRSLHDIGITSIAMSKTVVGQGFNLQINVSIMNYGNSTENFNVTIYVDTTSITSFVNITLTSRNSTTLAFTWNTAGFAEDNYSLTAYAHPVLGETDISNNRFTDCWIIVTIPGDVDGDFDVDIYDIVQFCGSYGYEEGNAKYISNCDIDADGDVDIYDIIIACDYYGRPCS